MSQIPQFLSLIIFSTQPPPSHLENLLTPAAIHLPLYLRRWNREQPKLPDSSLEGATGLTVHHFSPLSSLDGPARTSVPAAATLGPFPPGPCLPPPQLPSGSLRLAWSHFSQEGCSDPSTVWTGARKTCLEFFRGQIDYEGKQSCLQSSKENRFRLGCVCISFGPLEATGTHPQGSPFWSRCSADAPTDLPASSVVLKGLWQEAPHGYLDLCIQLTSFQTWTKWVCHFKRSNWQHLWPTVTFNLSRENENFSKTSIVMSLTTS